MGRSRSGRRLCSTQGREDQVRLVGLTTAEREVWERILRDGWTQMQLLFPRLAPFDGPTKPGIRWKPPKKL